MILAAVLVFFGALDFFCVAICYILLLVACRSSTNTTKEWAQSGRLRYLFLPSLKRCGRGARCNSSEEAEMGYSSYIHHSRPHLPGVIGGVCSPAFAE